MDDRARIQNIQDGILNAHLDSLDRCEDCDCEDPDRPETEEPADVNGQGQSACSCKCHDSYEPDPYDLMIDAQFDGPDREDY